MTAERVILERADIKHLWTNCRDSLHHAGWHFAELSDLKGKKGSPEEITHHAKWAVLSVGHAAGCYLQIVARDLDPTFPDSTRGNRRRKQIFWNTSLPQSIRFLEGPAVAGKLKDSDRKLFILLDIVHDKRNKIMHHMIPEELQVSWSDVAWAFMGLLRAVEQRYGIVSEKIVDQSPPIEATLLDLLGPRRFKPYTDYVQTTLVETHHLTEIEQCPLCGSMTVLNRRCEVCFEDIFTATCNACGEEILVPADSELARRTGLDVCPICGTDVQ